MSDNSNDYPEATRPTIWPPSSDEVLRARLPWSPPCRCRCLVEVSCMLQRSRDLACTHQKDASSVWWQPVSCRPVPEYGPFSIRYRTSMDVSDGSSSRNRRSRNPLQRNPCPKPDEPARGSGNLPVVCPLLSCHFRPSCKNAKCLDAEFDVRAPPVRQRTVCCH